MKVIIDYFIERSLVVNLLTVMVLLVGGFSLYNLQKETFPTVDFDVILISTVYPGSSSEDVEKLVTIPIERKLKGISGVKSMNALSAESRSIIYLEVEADEELEEVLDDVKNAVDSVDDLPTDAKIPNVLSLNNKSRGIIKVTLTGGTYDELRLTSKKLRDRLERMSEMSDINLDGYRPDEIRIELNPELMNQNEVTISEINRAIKERNISLSAGAIESDQGDLIVRTVSEFSNIEEIKNVVIVSNASGRSISIKDVANVVRVPEKSGILQRSNGVSAIFVDIKIKEKADILRTTEKLKKNVDDFFSKLDNKSIKFHYTDDVSYYVKRRLNILTENGIMGIVLVVICLMLFLNARTSLITSLGAPIAFMISFMAMEYLGLSLNLISMFALILVLGMLVDDSIIVAEHFYHKLEKGMDPKKAAKEASYETVRPVLATVLTTMIAFGSLFFMGGTMGKFLWPVPAVVIICLLGSLIECFIILPSHLADFCKLDKAKAKSKRWYDFATSYYGIILTEVLKRPKVILVIFFFVFIGSIALTRTMSFELFPGDDVRTAYIQIKGQVGSSLKQTDRAIESLEKMFLENLKKDELDQIKAQVGVLSGDHGNKTGSHYGSIIVYLTPPDERVRSTDEILDDLTTRAKKLVPDYVVTIKKQQGGPPRGKAVDIELTGESITELKAVSKQILDVLTKIDGVLAPEIDFEEGKDQVVVSVNDAESKRLGLSTTQIAMELRSVLSQDSLTEIRESDEDIEIKLILNDEARSKVDTLKKLYIQNKQGSRIPLMKVVNLSNESGAFVIRRLNRKRIFSITADLDKSKATPIKIAKIMKPKIREILSSHPTMDFAMGGENKDTKESMMRLTKSGVISLFAIFSVLVLMFGSLIHPIVIMSAIPLGLVGVIWTFKVTGQSLGFMALMGVVALVGVVVNDSIVLVSFINKNREEEPDRNLVDLVIESSKNRFRPVILTTFTTVAGLLPVAHPTISKILSLGKTVDSDPFIQPMAMSFAWGLLIASMVTLFFIPSCYIVIDRIKNWVMDKMGLFFGTQRS